MSLRQHLRGLRLFGKNRCDLQRTAKSGPGPAVERLEDRTVPTTTLFLDFGDAFPSNGLSMTVLQLRDTFANNGIQGPDLRTLGTPGMTDTTNLRFTSFNPLVNFDYNGNGQIDSQDATDLRGDVISLVQRYYAPFNISIQVTSNSTVAGVRATLQANNNLATGKNDAYLFVCDVVRTDTSAHVGADTGNFGIAAGADIGVGNTRDDCAIAFADNILASFPNARADTALAYTCAHEPGHTFGLQHTSAGLSGSDNDLLTRSDLIVASAFSDASHNRQNLDFFTRFPLPTVSGSPATENPYLQLANDPDIGPAPNSPADVTGTGADDLITLTRLDASHATVSVQAFRQATYAAADQIGATYTYTVDMSHGIHVEAGNGDDRIVVDATLGVNIDIYGMAGNDQLVFLGNGVTSATYQPGSYTVLGLDGNIDYHGFVTSGNTRVTYDEFEPTGSVIVQNIPNVTLTAAWNLNNQGNDTLTISSYAAGQNQVTGNTAGVLWVPLTTVNVGRLTVDAATNDASAVSADNVTVQSLGSPVTINTGGGDDTLTVSLAGGTPLPAGSLTFDGGTGSNTLILQGTSAYDAEVYTPSGPTSGTIDLSRGLVLSFPARPVLTYSNVQQITDTLSLSSFVLSSTIVLPPTFLLNGTANPDSVSLGNGTPVGSLTTLQVSSPSFAPVTFANKPNVYLYGLAGADTVTANYTMASTGLTSLLIDGGTENDTINLQQIAANVPVTVNGGAGDDTVNLGNPNASGLPGLDAMLSPVTVNGQDGNDTVNLLDNTAFFSDPYTITDTTVSRPFFGARVFTPPVAGLTYGTIENLVLQAETSDGVPGTGDNTITISNLNPATLVTVNGNGGNDTLVGPNFRNTWNLPTTGANTLSALLNISLNTVGHANFSGVENLTGGTSNDVFQFGAGGGVSGRIDGGGGTNSLDYSQWAAHYGDPGVTVTLADAPAVGTATGTGGVLNIQVVDGGRGNDRITGNSADNTIVTNGGLDVIAGGAGNDSIFIYGQQFAGTTIDGGTGTDTLKGNDGANTWLLTALGIGDVSDAYGSSHFSNIENLVGGLGSDTFRFATAGAGISGQLNGNAGIDWLDYSQFPGAVTVNLETGSAMGVAGGAAGHVVYMENVLGARNFANTLIGASTPLAGNPSINAWGNTLSSVLVGGTLADVIQGGAGRSILIGGSGVDTVTGGPADDLIIGGTTDWDTNTTALTALLQEWTRTDAAATYQHRIDDLRTGTTDPARRNGNYFLNAQTVHDDGQTDVLRGGIGLDWFWANVAEILDLTSGETRN